MKIEDPASAATSAATCRRSRRARTRSSSRPSTAARRASRSTCATPARRGVLHDLVRVVDAVYSNLRGDQPRKLGLTYEQLRDVNPRIVCCSLSGFGMTGPRAAEGGYDYMMQGLAGWQSPDRGARRPPTKSRPLARRPLRRLRVRDRAAGGPLARAPRRGRLRLRRLALRDRAARAHVHRAVGGDHGYVPPRRTQLGASVDRAVPELPGHRRLVRRRGREAEVLGATLRR